MSRRDDFTKVTVEILAKRAGMLCSNSNCRQPTAGPQADPLKSANIGVAAHITAAADGGPRYDSTLSAEARSSIENGIWLCQNCAKLVDNDQKFYTTAVLRSWKEKAEKAAHVALKGSKQSNAEISADIDFNWNLVQKFIPLDMSSGEK